MGIISNSNENVNRYTKDLPKHNPETNQKCIDALLDPKTSEKTRIRATELLFENNLPFAYQESMNEAKAHPNIMPLGDFITAGRVGISEAINHIEDYDASRSVFITFASFYVEKYLKDAIRQNTDICILKDSTSCSTVLKCIKALMDEGFERNNIPLKMLIKRVHDIDKTIKNITIQAILQRPSFVDFNSSEDDEGNTDNYENHVADLSDEAFYDFVAKVHILKHAKSVLTEKQASLFSDISGFEFETGALHEPKKTIKSISEECGKSYEAVRQQYNKAFKLVSEYCIQEAA